MAARRRMVRRPLQQRSRTRTAPGHGIGVSRNVMAGPTQAGIGMMSAGCERSTYSLIGSMASCSKAQSGASRDSPLGPPRSERSVDLYVRRGEVRDPRNCAKPPGMRLSAAPDGAAFLELRGLARFLVRGGREVTVDPQANADPALIRACSTGWIVAMVCVQRDFLVLHASAVAFGDRVIAFMGDQGAGKSTLAAHCVRAGAKLVADDLLRIEMADEGPPLAHPGMPTLKLLGDTLEHLGRDSARLPRAWERAQQIRHIISGRSHRNRASGGSPLFARA